MIIEHSKQDDFLELLRQDKIPQGLGIGVALDNHIRYKRGSFNCILGHANTGKTYFVIFYLTALSVKHGFKHLIYSSENTVESLKRNILELYANQKVTTMTHKQLESNKDWLEAHFDFIEAKEWSIIDFMKEAQKIGKNYDSLMIDPHNSFVKPFGVNSHEHDYLTATKLRMFAKKFDCSVYLCMHASTEALRKTHRQGDYEGYPIRPNGSDAEGGGKWVNRCDDFITIHRYTQHPTEWMYTQVHVLKVKDTMTGGSPTYIDQPVLFKLDYGTAFTCEGVNALDNASPFKSLENNTNFDDEMPF